MEGVEHPANLCTICEDQSCNVILKPCGHWQYCHACISMWLQHGQTCPLCRGRVDQIVEALR
eukprot:Skav207070  [mRNA]  locus=scaffold1909:127980:128165:+ [translate_table: standard]